MYQAAVLTVSDRSFRGERPDTAGPLVAQLLESAGYQVCAVGTVPDEQPEIEAVLKDWADRARVQLVVTTGGTGFAPREALMVGDRLYTDVACGVNAGIDTAFVLSGEGTRADLAGSEVRPTWIFDDIAALHRAWKKEQSS